MYDLLVVDGEKINEGTFSIKEEAEMFKFIKEDRRQIQKLGDL
jgi:hypothetical protein